MADDENACEKEPRLSGASAGKQVDANGTHEGGAVSEIDGKIVPNGTVSPSSILGISESFAGGAPSSRQIAIIAQDLSKHGVEATQFGTAQSESRHGITGHVNFGDISGAQLPDLAAAMTDIAHDARLTPMAVRGSKKGEEKCPPLIM